MDEISQLRITYVGHYSSITKTYSNHKYVEKETIYVFDFMIKQNIFECQ